MKFFAAKAKLPSLTNSLLAVLAAIFLTLAFPDFDLWILAWFALVPLFYAIEREKESIVKSLVLGWIFGTLFFAGSCWWITFSFITYGGIPTLIAYFLLLVISSILGFFPAIFSAVFSLILKRFGTYGILFAPFLWTAVEFLRFNLTGNNWNAIGYSQTLKTSVLKFASVGGVYLVGFLVVAGNAFFIWLYRYLKKEFGDEIFVQYARHRLQFFDYTQNEELLQKTVTDKQQLIILALVFAVFLVPVLSLFVDENFFPSKPFVLSSANAFIIVVQANVPMSGLNDEKWLNLRQRHVELAENAIANPNFTNYVKEQTSIYSKPENPEERKKFYTEFALENFQKSQKIIIFPESPMNFMYGEDVEFRQFIGDFARKHNAYVLFNSAEPNPRNKNFYNSAIMVNPQGEKIGQYDKIHLVPFGEFAPVPSAIQQFIPTLVGNFQFGENYNLFPFGEAKGGIMICYESHFPSLSREFVRRGADVLIEMTNDGYLGNTPVLRQHLANAVFRAVETNRPVLRATNVGITAFINERGEVQDAADVYTEATRVWTISKSDGKQTFYVRYGEWFAWLCSIVSLSLLFLSFRKRKV